MAVSSERNPLLYSCQSPAEGTRYVSLDLLHPTCHLISDLSFVVRVSALPKRVQGAFLKRSQGSSTPAVALIRFRAWVATCRSSAPLAPTIPPSTRLL